MAQRYTDPRALERMAAGACPECGGTPFSHGVLFGADCSLRRDGVEDRIAQYKADVVVAEQAEAERLAALPLSEAQRKALVLMAQGRDPGEGVSGMAGYGGLSGTMAALTKRGLIAYEGNAPVLTDRGNAALDRPCTRKGCDAPVRAHDHGVFCP